MTFRLLRTLSASSGAYRYPINTVMTVSISSAVLVLPLPPEGHTFCETRTRIKQVIPASEMTDQRFQSRNPPLIGSDPAQYAAQYSSTKLPRYPNLYQ